jgi:DNA-binding CsgD family transcriptional regulator
MFERQAHHTNRNWALAAGLRGRGLLASGSDFERYFEAALALHRRTPTPFETARTELCLGERFRQVGRHEEAGRALTSALTTFDQLGASPWAARARRELSAAGAIAPQAVQSANDQLTPHELIVALRVVDGASNKEIAAALTLSTKTIEFHLGNAYRKLGLHSRAGLAGWLAREGALAPATPPRAL